MRIRGMSVTFVLLSSSIAKDLLQLLVVSSSPNESDLF